MVNSLYVHIPFCTKKCPYCHFFVAPDRPDLKAPFLHALKQEWDLRELAGPFESIYFGGGTPALYPEAIEAVLSWAGPQTCEITVEANPEGAPFERFAAAGVNRVSIGVQSLDDALLKQLGRTHSASDARNAVLAAHRAGIHNITIDLMYEIPGQTVASWRDTLAQLADLPITHLSLYNLTLEPGTPFGRQERKLRTLLPHPEHALLMLNEAVQALHTLGLNRYEISAFARPGFESHHNTGYWTARPFYGLGPSAFSYREGTRSRNVASLFRYQERLAARASPTDFTETLAPEAHLRELLAVELRLLRGVPQEKFPLFLQESVAKLIQRGWLIEEEGRFRLTEAGTLFYDSVAVELI